MAYSLLGINDPKQWGIGQNDTWLTRFGAGMQRGMVTGDAMNQMVMNQQSRQARRPYEDAAAIAASRNARMKSELGQLDTIADMPAAACNAIGWASDACKKYAAREVAAGKPDPSQGAASMGALAPTQSLDGSGSGENKMRVAGGNIMSFGGNNNGYVELPAQDDESAYWGSSNG